MFIYETPQGELRIDVDQFDIGDPDGRPLHHYVPVYRATLDGAPISKERTEAILADLGDDLVYGSDGIARRLSS